MSCPLSHNGARRVLAGRIAEEGVRHAGLAVDIVHGGPDAGWPHGLRRDLLGRDLPVVHGDQAARTASGHNLSARI
jgi:hypothetical protein